MLNLAAAYIRVSTEEQGEFSPDAQLKAIQNYCKNNNLILNKEKQQILFLVLLCYVHWLNVLVYQL